MTPADYRSARKERGTMKEVARQLGVDWTTLQRRETGRMKITRESMLALLVIQRKHQVVGTFKTRIYDLLLQAKKALCSEKYLHLASEINDVAVQLNLCHADLARPFTPIPIPEAKPSKKALTRKLHLR
jgi:hypothetical protein